MANSKLLNDNDMYVKKRLNTIWRWYIIIILYKLYQIQNLSLTAGIRITDRLGLVLCENTVNHTHNDMIHNTCDTTQHTVYYVQLNLTALPSKANQKLVLQSQHFFLKKMIWQILYLVSLLNMTCFCQIIVRLI